MRQSLIDKMGLAIYREDIQSGIFEQPRNVRMTEAAVDALVEWLRNQAVLSGPDYDVPICDYLADLLDD